MTRRVLVVRLDSFGDVIVCGPAVRAIAAAPGVEVVMLCGPQGAPAADLLPDVVGVSVWSAPWVAESGRPLDEAAVAEFVQLVVSTGADEAVILTSFHQSPLPAAMLLRLAGVRRISGASVDHPGTLLDVRLRPGEDFDEDQPEPLRALAIAHAAGYDLPTGDDGALRVRVDQVAPASVRSIGRYVVVHPGTSVPARAWPAAHYRALVRTMHDRGIRVVVTGSAGERDLTRIVADDVALDVGGQTSPAQLAAVLAGADAVVVGNTGPAHLAAAVGTPIVSLFAPVVPAVRWAPFGPRVIVLGDQQAACRSSRARECPVSGHPCLTSVSPDLVFRTLVDRFGVRPLSEVRGTAWEGPDSVANPAASA